MPLLTGAIEYPSSIDGTVERLKARTGTDGTPGNEYEPVRRIVGDPLTFTETQLTAPGETTARDARGYEKLLFILNVSNIDSSISVRPEVSFDNSSWTALGEDTVLEDNGSHIIGFDWAVIFGYVRVNWVSETGGTSATLDIITVIQ